MQKALWGIKNCSSNSNLKRRALHPNSCMVRILSSPALLGNVIAVQIPVYRAVVIEAKPKASPEGEVPRRGGGVCGCPAAAKCFGSSTPQSASLTAPLEGSLFGCLHYLKQLDKLEFEERILVCCSQLSTLSSQLCTLLTAR